MRSTSCSGRVSHMGPDAAFRCAVCEAHTSGLSEQGAHRADVPSAIADIDHAAVSGRPQDTVQLLHHASASTKVFCPV